MELHTLISFNKSQKRAALERKTYSKFWRKNKGNSNAIEHFIIIKLPEH